jgi:hypothetical protein
MQRVFVLSQHKRALMPCMPARARQLLKQGRARVFRAQAGWLPPSLMSRIDNIINFVKKLTTLSVINGIAVETVRFDTQKLINPEISGVQYQQGTLQGYEIREYLLEKTRVLGFPSQKPRHCERPNPKREKQG